jgi:hypothetical protein
MENHSKTIAGLESKLDFLETELGVLDALLRECGFEKGIATLKIAAKQLISEDKN